MPEAIAPNPTWKDDLDAFVAHGRDADERHRLSGFALEISARLWETQGRRVRAPHEQPTQRAQIDRQIDHMLPGQFMVLDEAMMGNAYAEYATSALERVLDGGPRRPWRDSFAEAQPWIELRERMTARFELALIRRDHTDVTSPKPRYVDEPCSVSDFMRPSDGKVWRSRKMLRVGPLTPVEGDLLTRLRNSLRPDLYGPDVFVLRLTRDETGALDLLRERLLVEDCKEGLHYGRPDVVEGAFTRRGMQFITPPKPS